MQHVTLMQWAGLGVAVACLCACGKRPPAALALPDASAAQAMDNPTGSGDASSWIDCVGVLNQVTTSRLQVRQRPALRRVEPDVAHFVAYLRPCAH